MQGVVFCLLLAVVALESRGVPPEISIPGGNNWPKPIVYIRRGDKSVFQCAATGSGILTYKWQLNGTDIDNSNPEVLAFDSATGDITLGEFFGPLNSGDYQCIVSNDYGTAMTPYLTLLATRAEAFPGVDNQFPENVQAHVSKYLMLPCKDVPISVPQWTFSWEKHRMGVNQDTTSVEVGDRLVIDPEGNLHFLWLEDTDNNYIYSCAGSNEVILITVKNTHTIQLKVNKGQRKNRNPDLKYNENVVVRAGDDADLTCIFTYYSERQDKLSINWVFDNQVIGSGNKLKLKNVKVPSDTQSQEGEYLCEASLPGYQVTRGKVKLTIVAPPEFLKEPQSTSFPVEKDAIFHCEASSHNSYTKPPVWLVNSKPLIGCPPRMFECTSVLQDGYSQCIHEKSVCNNFPDCDDESDEANCPVICGENFKECDRECISEATECEIESCEFPRFRCHDGYGCVEAAQKCDGDTQCSDGSDEKACPNRDRLSRNRFTLNSQRTELVLPSVKLSDTMCFQCIVENDYGSVLGDGCLNVIDKIVLLLQPNSTYYTEPGQTINIGVDAVTDKDWQNQMTYQWMWYRPAVHPDTGEKILVKEKVIDSPYSDYFKLSLSDKNMTIFIPEVKAEDEDTTTYDVYQTLTENRLYSIVISHKFDEVVVNFTVAGKEIEKPVVKPVVTTASFNPLFIVLILGILLLFIVVALIICYMHRNRGGTYLLDKKEQQAGHDPERELKDSGFHDVGRIGDDDYDNEDGEKVSLSESVKPYESDEDITEEYGGDFDVSKFNEDGSFIGLYGDKKSKYSSESKEATV